MNGLSIFVLLAITLNVAHGRSFRLKRQSSDDDDKNTLDNRYGWNGPIWDWAQRPERGNGPNLPNGRNPRPVNTPQPILIGPPQSIMIDPPQTTPVPTAGTTTESSAIQECIRTCPVTPEYNPVCGTNMVLYSNPGRLECARYCGVNVTLLRPTRCPSTPTTTAVPAS